MTSDEVVTNLLKIADDIERDADSLVLAGNRAPLGSNSKGLIRRMRLRAEMCRVLASALQ